MNYIGILEKEPATLWGLWFPDLPGCVTAAEQSEACIAQASEAVDLWIEDATASGDAVPQSRTLEELRLEPCVSEAFARGGAAIIVPVPIRELDLDETTLTKLGRRAAERGLTRIAFLREAVIEKLAS